MVEPNEAPAGRSAADLERLLADRERRITELTDQLLGVLDQLTASRREAAGRRQTQQLLHDAQRRLQRAARPALDLDADAATRCELVCWQTPGQQPWAPEQLTALAERSRAPVVWVGPADQRPVGIQSAEDTVRLHGGADCRTVVEAWNEAMHATTAPWVWLLAPGSTLADGLLPEALAPADADPLAALTPHLSVDGPDGKGTARCGLVDPEDALRFQPGKPVAEAGIPLAAVTPELFAVRRAAFEVLGPFDRELRGPLAAAEWCLRAGYEGYRVVSRPEVQGTAQPLPKGQDLRDHPLLLARHRREQLVGTLPDHPVWRRLQGQPLREFTTILMNRLGVPAPARDLLMPVLLQLAGGRS